MIVSVLCERGICSAKCGLEHQKDIIEKAKEIQTVKSVKTTYGIYDLIIILESNNMQEIKQAIDVDLHKIDGISNLTSLISVS